MTALVVAAFAEAAPFRAAIRTLREADRAIVGLWSPIAIDMTDGPGTNRIAPIMACAGIAGAGLFYLFIWWSATQAYPFDSGGRPLDSWPVFLIAPIELGALIAGIAGLIAFFVAAKLTNLHDAAFDIDEVGAAMADRFVLAVRCDAGADANILLAMLGDAGAVHSRMIDR